MKKTLRRFCLSTVLCGTALLAAMQQGAAQSESASSRILRTTPQSVEDLQRIEHQLQAVLPKVLPALVCIQVNNSVTAQDSCDMRDRLLRYFATCGQEKPLSGSLKRGEKNA